MRGMQVQSFLMQNRQGKHLPNFSCVFGMVGALILIPTSHACGDFFYTGSRNDAITQIDEYSGEIRKVFATSIENGFSDFRGMTFGPDGLLYASGRGKFTGLYGNWGVYRFDPQSGNYVDTFIADGPLEWISFGPGDEFYAVDSWTDKLKKYDGSTGALLQTVLESDDYWGVGTFVLGEHGDFFATTEASKLARYDLATGNRVGPITDLEEIGLAGYGFDQMTLGPDGDLYVTYNYRYRDTVKDGGVVRFDSVTGELLDILIDDLRAFGAANGGTLGIAFDPSGDLYIGSQEAEAVLVFNGSTFEKIREIPVAGLAASATFIQFQPVAEPATFLESLLCFVLMVSCKRPNRSFRVA